VRSLIRLEVEEEEEEEEEVEEGRAERGRRKPVLHGG